MIRIAWSNLRSASGRLSAAMIAIAVSVAFIVAALLFSQAFGDTLRNQVRAEWAGADVAVTAAASEDPAAAAGEASPLTDSMRQTVADVDGVESAQLTESAFVAVSAGSTSVTGSATNLPQGQTETVDGTAPDSDDELMLREADAKTLGVGVGDSITLAEFDGARRSAADGPSYTVSGIMPGSSAAGMNLYLTDGGLKSAPGELVPDSIRVVADDGSDRTALAEAVVDIRHLKAFHAVVNDFRHEAHVHDFEPARVAALLQHALQHVELFDVEGAAHLFHVPDISEKLRPQ